MTTGNLAYKKFFVRISISLSVIFIIYTASLYLSSFHQAVIGYGLLIVVWILTKTRLSIGQPVRTLICTIAAFITLRYWFFRTFDTLTYTGFFDSIAMLSLYAAETYSTMFVHILGMFVNVYPIERKSPPLPENVGLLPSVDVFIPTYNEPEDIVRVTALACMQMDYPKEKLNIYILDDGGTVQKRNDPNPEKAAAALERHKKIKGIAQTLKINYITREKNERAKAGNINNALKHTSLGYENRDTHSGEWFNFGNISDPGEIILILDCDHVPTRDFLKNTVGFFLKDEKLFLVQTPHFFINPSPLEKNLVTHNDAPDEPEMFYRAVHQGLDFWNASFFCGSAALLRRKYLEEIGGIAGDTITEDAETALSLHAKGYRSVYLPKPMICGLSPETFDDFITQRSRWTQGMLQILLLKNPLFFKGLKWYQKICYMNSCIFWFFGIARFIFILAPLAYLLFGLRIYNASASQILTYALPHLLCSMMVTNYLYGKVRQPFFSELFETAQSIFLIFPILGVLLNPRSPKFKVTPKGKNLNTDFVSGLATPFYVILLLTLAGIPAGLFRWVNYPLEREAVVVCMVWALFNLFLVLSCLGGLYELRQIRKHHRIMTKEKATVTIPENNINVKGTINNVSLGGLNITLHEELDIPLNKSIIVSVADSYNNNYTFRTIVKQSRKDNNSTLLGCMFDVSDIREFGSIIGFVYGDSARWENFWQRKEGRASILAGFLYLFYKGIKGSLRNIRGTFLLIKEKIIITQESVWHKFRNTKPLSLKNYS